MKITDIPNPYIAGGPIRTKKGFFGRDEIFKAIKKIFEQDMIKNIVFRGGRRTGKTSICWQIVNGCLGEQYLPIRLSFEDLALSSTINDAFHKIIEEIYRSCQLPDKTFNLGPFSLEALERNPYQIFKDFLIEIEKFAEGKKLLLLLDEYDIIYNQVKKKIWDERVIDFWNNLIKSLPGINFILVGSQSLFVAKKEAGSSITDIAGTYQEITFLTKEETTDLIQKPVEGILNYSDQAIEKILRLSHGHPYFTQVVCLNIFNVCKCR